MRVLLNNIKVELPADCLTLEDVLKWREINPIGTAVALNEKLILRSDWKHTILSEGDRITVITAAFGG